MCISFFSVQFLSVLRFHPISIISNSYLVQWYISVVTSFCDISQNALSTILRPELLRENSFGYSQFSWSTNAVELGMRRLLSRTKGQPAVMSYSKFLVYIYI